MREEIPIPETAATIVAGGLAGEVVGVVVAELVANRFQLGPVVSWRPLLASSDREGRSFLRQPSVITQPIVDVRVSRNESAELV